MQLGPCFNKPLLPSGKRACYQLHRVNTINRYIILIIGMKMWSMMRRVYLPIHANNDTEETTEFRHEGILQFNLKRRKEMAWFLASTNAINRSHV
jgi:hypothetical protein